MVLHARVCGRVGRRPINIKKAQPFLAGLLDITGQLPSLPHTCACSTIGAEGLNFRVRDGNGWNPLAMVTQNLLAAVYCLAAEPVQVLDFEYLTGWSTI